MDERLQKLDERLHGRRLKAPSTIKGYTATARRFLIWLGKKKAPAEADYDRYFAERRKQGISERTLLTESFQIQKLALANDWTWSITKDDRPYPKDKPYQPVLSLNQVEQLIMAQKSYSDAERFYLALATIYICRREAMAQLVKRNYDDQTIVIPGVHGGKTIKHLIPDVIKPVILEYRFKQHEVKTLSDMFRHMSKKAGLELPSGFGWHSFRRTLTTYVKHLLFQNRINPAIWTDFTGWAGGNKGEELLDSDMSVYYEHKEILSEDPYYIDRLVFTVHPCLKFWQKALTSRQARPKATAHA